MISLTLILTAASKTVIPCLNDKQFYSFTWFSLNINTVAMWCNVNIGTVLMRCNLYSIYWKMFDADAFSKMFYKEKDCMFCFWECEGLLFLFKLLDLQRKCSKHFITSGLLCLSSLWTTHLFIVQSKVELVINNELQNN